MSDNPITFKASFPAIQSAIKRDGSGGGMRISLDIPESEMAQAVQLIAMVQQRLIVTIEADNDNNNGTRTPKRTKARK
jgi:hypothetical protein